tara:strand:+ start:411 stop:662 length:252 start_codon:yes stop_codon:yes gene_type:complete
MKLEVVNNLISFVGKNNEKPAIVRAMDAMAKAMCIDKPAIFDNSVEECNLCDIGFANECGYTVSDVRDMWRSVKSKLKAGGAV